jgi:hypothetical protein
MIEKNKQQDEEIQHLKEKNKQQDEEIKQLKEKYICLLR